VIAEGSRIKLHIVATAEQLEAVLQLTAAAVNAQLAPASGGGGGPAPQAPSPRE